MKRAFEDAVIDIHIKWSRPKLYEKAISIPEEHIEKVYFYKILLRYSNTPYKLYYIGKSERYVTERLKDLDHKKKLVRIKKDFPNHRVYLSFGEIIDYNNRKKYQIKEIETLLIYTSEYSYLTNKKSVYSHKIKDEYTITNSGFTKGGMRKKIYLGAFYK